MSDVVSFLTSKLDEAEELARTAGIRDTKWYVMARPPVRWGEDDPPGVVLMGGKPILKENEEYACLAAEFVVANDPASVLRRIAADRRTLARHQPKHSRYGGKPWCTRCCDWSDPYERPTSEEWPCPELINRAEGWGWTGETS